MLRAVVIGLPECARALRASGGGRDLGSACSSARCWRLPAALWALPALGVPAGFLALGLVVGTPVFPLLHRSLGTVRALLLAAITAVTATVVIAVLAFGACVATGCVG
jgi:hypothetical protein